MSDENFITGDQIWDYIEHAAPVTFDYDKDVIMPFGKYMGRPLGKIPADYRLWILKNFNWNGRRSLERHVAASLGIKSI